MRICPRCDKKFPDTYSLCRDCNVELVLSVEQQEAPDLVVLCTVLNEAKAYIMQGFLWKVRAFPASWKTYLFTQSLRRSRILRRFDFGHSEKMRGEPVVYWKNVKTSSFALPVEQKW